MCSSDLFIVRFTLYFTDIFCICKDSFNFDHVVYVVVSVIFGLKFVNQLDFNFPLYSLAYFETKENKNQTDLKNFNPKQIVNYNNSKNLFM